MYKVIQEYHVQKAKVIQQALENLQILGRDMLKISLPPMIPHISYQHLKPAEIRALQLTTVLLPTKRRR